MAPTDLPIETALPPLMQALEASGAAVLVAPPGAGKTTRVPLALLGASWRGDNRIIVLEPRRIAARAAALRMAETLNEKLGGTVGLRARLDTRVSKATRVEVVTEGVFTRMILADPELDGVAAVLFDEFHERSVDADLGLALALDARAGLRPDLRLVVMSATLAGAEVAGLLGEASLIESAGRQYDVETRYLPRGPDQRLEDAMADAVSRALREETGSVLAFLPGQGEIRRVFDRLSERVSDPTVTIAPLYGALDPSEQDRAIRPASPGARKVVLATAIAETSLTIEGVRVVIDSGLTREPRFEPGRAISRLVTVRASKAAVDQRRGRAGRTETGVCYRLWDEAQTMSLPAYATPEILTADLAGLVLDLADWGVSDPAGLSWLDPPPAAALDAARQTLADIGALDEAHRITTMGRAIRRLPLPPRLSAMILAAAAEKQPEALREAAEFAALLIERGLGGNDVDLAERQRRFRADRSPRSRKMRGLIDRWCEIASEAAREDASGAAAPGPRPGSPAPPPARHLARAFPGRVAMARGKPGQFLLAGGRGASLDPVDPLARARFLVAADLQGAAANTRILAAIAFEPDELDAIAAGRIESREELYFDTTARAVRKRECRHLGAIVLDARPSAITAEERANAGAVLASGLAGEGVDRLPWSKAQRQLRARAAFVRQAGDTELPDLSETALNADAASWLAPFLAGKTAANEVNAADLATALDALIPWNLRGRLDETAPTHFLAPTGERHPIDYDSPSAPALHIRVQELYGLTQHPSIADGRLPLTLHLLSPAHRPIQITRDLPGFWQGSWASVKAEMKGRYPKHLWPDDPANAAPTRRAKPRKA